jgi:hypothetical protein
MIHGRGNWRRRRGGEEGLGSLRRGKGQTVMITTMVEEPDAQEVIPRLAAEADLVPSLSDDGLDWFVPADPRGRLPSSVMDSLQ